MRDEREGPEPRRMAEERNGSETARLLASAARPVAVPPGARQRVITRALARRQERGSGWRLVAVAGAAIVLFVWWAVRGSETAEPFAQVASSEGEVRIEEPGRSVAAAEAGAAVGDGARMATGAHGGASVRFADLELRLGRATGAILSRRGSGVEIGLERGEVSLVVGRRPPDRPVVVGAAGYSVVVLGTVFAVRASPDGAVDVTVAEGRVRVTGRGVERQVRAGEVWSSRASAAAVAPAPPSPPATAVAAPPPAPIAPAASPRARSPARPQRVAVARATPTRLAAPRRVAAAPPPAPGPAALPFPAPAAASVPPPSAAPPPSPVPAAPPAAPPAAAGAAAAPAGQDGYEEAQALASRGRYAQAAASFARMSAAGPRAELALYERGLLLLQKLDEPERARRVFLEHRRRFPESSLGPEVDLSLIEASLRAKELPEAAREIDAFLARYPSNERRDELRLLRANLARDGGDCAHAEREYEALARGAGELAEEALHSWVYCRRRLGDEAGARERLREYLRRFPSGRHRRDVEQALGVGR
jgi:TolA-binding protein